MQQISLPVKIPSSMDHIEFHQNVALPVRTSPPGLAAHENCSRFTAALVLATVSARMQAHNITLDLGLKDEANRRESTSEMIDHRDRMGGFPPWLESGMSLLPTLGMELLEDPLCNELTD